jgi:hypothetical protein
MSNFNNFTLLKDINGNVTYYTPFPGENACNSITLATNDTAELTVPDGATIAGFQISGGPVLIGTSEIVAPTGAFAQGDWEINPTGRSVVGVTTLYFLALGDSLLNVRFDIGTS